jgi:putative DNA primase/helicase
MTAVRTLLDALGGEKNGNGILCPAPGHSPRDRGMRVWPDSTDPLGFKVHLFNGGDWQTAKHHVARALGMQEWHPGATPPRPAARLEVDRSRNVDLARAIHNTSVPAMGTLAERYLADRGLAVVDALCFHPSCPFGQERLPAMIAAMVDIHGSSFRGIHRTPLNPDGGKADIGKKMLGSSAGAVVKLSPDEEVTTVLGIGEGIETTLSLPVLPECLGIPVWACLSAGGVATFPVLSGIEVLWIAVDNDPSGAGERAAQRCADRWTAAGCEVWLQTPSAVRSDLNDVVKEYRDAR